MTFALVATISMLQTPISTVKIWEKWIAPGLEYVMEWEPGKPWIINALRINLKSTSIRPISELAGKTVYEDTPSFGRGTVTSMVQADSGLGGINGDFFPFKGNPLNLMVRDGELLEMPYQPKEFPTSRRPVFGWGDKSAQFGFARTSMTLTPDGSKSIPIDGLNEESIPGQTTINSQSAGIAYGKAPNSYAIIEIQDGKWAPTGQIRGDVIETGNNLTKRNVLPGTAIVIGEDAAAPKIAALQKSEEVTISMNTTGFDWSKITNVMGGSTTLLKDKKVDIDSAEAREAVEFTDLRHPRSAVGVNGRGDIWLVAVDGRTKYSIGATLPEMAAIMSSFGCVNAMNMDGGGSTAINVLGMTMNHPSDGVEREVANAIIVLGTPHSASNENLTFIGPSLVSLDQSVTLAIKVVGNKGNLPNSQILWNAEGAAWIDEGGTLHPTRAGIVNLTARVHGQLLESRITIVDQKAN